MVNFLNLTGPELGPYFQAYCLNPPGDDNCPFGFCPNGDIAGPFVRLASESTLIFCYIEAWLFIVCQAILLHLVSVGLLSSPDMVFKYG